MSFCVHLEKNNFYVHTAEVNCFCKASITSCGKTGAVSGRSRSEIHWEKVGVKRKQLFCSGYSQMVYNHVCKYMHLADSIRCKRNEYWPTICSSVTHASITVDL